jgi:hypothetical protein
MEVPLAALALMAEATRISLSLRVAVREIRAEEHAAKAFTPGDTVEGARYQMTADLEAMNPIGRATWPNWVLAAHAVRQQVTLDAGRATMLSKCRGHGLGAEQRPVEHHPGPSSHLDHSAQTERVRLCSGTTW